MSGGGAELWPPLHKYRTITLAECAQAGQDQCSGPLPVETYGRILRVTSDEVEDENGNGDPLIQHFWVKVARIMHKTFV